MTETRRYSSTLRDEQVRLTRRRVLDAARELFLAKGYVGTTIEAVATAAGVSVQTVYNVVGGKPKLVKAVHDVTLAGDDEPIPMADRPAYRQMMAETDARRYVARYVALGLEIHQKVGPLIAILAAQAAAGDRELQGFVETVETERSIGSTNFVCLFDERFGLRPGFSVGLAADLVWALFAWETMDRLLHQRNWPPGQVVRWLTQLVLDILYGPERQLPAEAEQR